MANGATAPIVAVMLSPTVVKAPVTFVSAVPAANTEVAKDPTAKALEPIIAGTKRFIEFFIVLNHPPLNILKNLVMALIPHAKNPATNKHAKDNVNPSSNCWASIVSPHAKFFMVNQTTTAAMPPRIDPRNNSKPWKLML